MAKIATKSVRMCLEHVLGRLFRKFFRPVFHGGSSLRKISKKIEKFSKLSKIVPKSVQTCFENVLGHFSEKNFCPVFHGGSSLQLFLIWMPYNSDSLCRKAGKKLELWRPALHASILHCETKSAMIAPPNTVTDSYTRFSPREQPYLNSMTRTAKSKLYYITDNNLSTHWWVVYAIFLLCLKTACFITLLNYTQHFHIADLFPILTHCWDWWSIPYFVTLLSYTHS